MQRQEKFISLLLKYNIGTHKLSYINAGHNSKILLNNNQAIDLNKGCTLLGNYQSFNFVRNRNFINFSSIYFIFLYRWINLLLIAMMILFLLKN